MSDISSPIRVLIVDDSIVIRGFIVRILEQDSIFSVAATASNGLKAIEFLKNNTVDVIILDIEMPVMDGLEAIPKIKELDSFAQIVMASTLTQKNAEISIKALSLGATDYIPKPSSLEISHVTDFKRELRDKVEAIGRAAQAKRSKALEIAKQKDVVVRRDASAVPVFKTGKDIVLRPMSPLFVPSVIAVGSSTGGPQAVLELIKSIHQSIRQPVVITQHMPPSFTTIFADNIKKQFSVNCCEAQDGQVLEAGGYYVAPGDYHMLFVKQQSNVVIKLTKDPKENFCRPAVDPMIRSLVSVFGSKVLAVILTGMGYDGLKGSQVLADAGGVVISQDEASSVVWGMPGAVAGAGLSSAVLPLNDLGRMLIKIAKGGQK
ncbi:MAG: chemotaxis response regulator protein-glutamate methylesterase [Alphaproteobacteria bacterium]|nr:chemotaxis response regulator protein-glutamate methylesterase [Alphaproteobacteria bacterium]MCL2505003.1 chemotaxis response regulator protein-glutamate methylesterase [Alphaproteobacteria bacterium]